MMAPIIVIKSHFGSIKAKAKRFKINNRIHSMRTLVHAKNVKINVKAIRVSLNQVQ